MTAHRSPGAPVSLELPTIEVIDQLDREQLVMLLTELGLLTARATARLVLAGTPLPRATPDAYLTAEDVARLLGTEPSWVYRHRGQLGGIKLDGLVRFSRRRLEAYIARQARVGT